MGQNLTFSRTVFDNERNNHLGEWTACFGKDEGVAKAFAAVAAKPGLKTGGVVALSLGQINQRIDQLSALGGHDTTIAQLEKGRHAIEERQKPHAQPGVAAQLRA